MPEAARLKPAGTRSSRATTGPRAAPKPTSLARTFAVFDGVLPPDDFRRVCEYVARQRKMLVHAETYDPVFSLDDGQPRQGPVVFAEAERRGRAVTAKPDSTLARELHPYPTGQPVDLVVRALLRIARKLEPWTGRAIDDWLAITCRAYEYPAGTSLAWHTDARPYSGAFVYYAHDRWEPAWGGELLVAESRNAQPSEGRYFVPTPNRLVVIRGGTPHKIARVTQLAGGRVRASIAGFFVRASALARGAAPRG